MGKRGRRLFLRWVPWLSLLSFCQKLYENDISMSICNSLKQGVRNFDFLVNAKVQLGVEGGCWWNLKQGFLIFMKFEGECCMRSMQWQLGT